MTPQTPLDFALSAIGEIVALSLAIAGVLVWML